MSGNGDANSMGFEDHDHYKTWLRFKEAAGKENDWMKQRLGWMLAAQAALLAVYGLKADVLGYAVTNAKELKDNIPFVGILISLIGFGGTLAAAQMHWLWTTNLNLIVDFLERRGNVGVLSFGSRPHWAARSSSILPPTQAYVFLCFWVYLSPLQSQLKEAWLEYTLSAAAILVLIFGMLVVRTIKSRWTGTANYDWDTEAQLSSRNSLLDRLRQWRARQNRAGPITLICRLFDRLPTPFSYFIGVRTERSNKADIAKSDDCEC